MIHEFDALKLAQELAEIARTTMDPVTGVRLMEIAHRLLTEAGLPDEDDHGGGEPPTRWTSEPLCEPA